ncbi:MAG: deoxyribonuclease V [Bacteroidota bacterium]|nr:deoxyribonuclease V [Bacteroidota bacterium]MDE2833806.1 deoxyribonuclease V [Bacteroidota bacterium]MDE2955875.1 deoxyribonuclease V [Bacteroidota bacterium]
MDRLAGAQNKSWEVSVAEARMLQDKLAAEVVARPLIGPVRRIAGVDVSVRGGRCRAAIVVMDYPGCTVQAAVSAQQRVTWPYVPGLLAFREIPPIMQAWEKLHPVPDVIMVDGHGRAHIRRCGLACHVGVMLKIPTIGVAKRRFVGHHEDPGTDKGSWVPLTDSDTGELLGAVVRTRSHVSPVFVSIGHAITLKESIALTLRCAVRYRLPEPTRQAHLESRRWNLEG